LVFSDGENTLRVQIVTDLCPAQHTVHGWQIMDIKVEIEELASKRVEFLIFDQLGQDVLGFGPPQMATKLLGSKIQAATFFH
jgi:hypothetical protein